jgi:hypothetical protein
MPDFFIATTLQDVRLALAQEEATKVSLGTMSRHKVSMATFLMTGFELEDSQYVLVNCCLFFLHLTLF